MSAENAEGSEEGPGQGFCAVVAGSGSKGRVESTAQNVTKMMQQCTELLKQRMEERTSSSPPSM